MHKHVCPWWFAYTFDNPLRRLFHNPDKIFSKYVKPGMKVIDIGCGLGYFSIGMARMIGTTGKVIAVDLQQKMLDILMQRANKAGVADRITPILCSDDNIRVNEAVDFALLFWMVHETPSAITIFDQVHTILNKRCKLLYAEPKRHVSLNEFNETVALAQGLGFRQLTSPSIRFSYAALLEKQ